MTKTINSPLVNQFIKSAHEEIKQNSVNELRNFLNSMFTSVTQHRKKSCADLNY